MTWTAKVRLKLLWLITTNPVPATASSATHLHILISVFSRHSKSQGNKLVPTHLHILINSLFTLNFSASVHSVDIRMLICIGKFSTKPQPIAVVLIYYYNDLQVSFPVLQANGRKCCWGKSFALKWAGGWRQCNTWAMTQILLCLFLCRSLWDRSFSFLCVWWNA